MANTSSNSKVAPYVSSNRYTFTCHLKRKPDTSIAQKTTDVVSESNFFTKLSEWFDNTTLGKWIIKRKLSQAEANTFAAKKIRALDKKICKFRDKFFEFEVKYVNLKEHSLNYCTYSLSRKTNMKAYVDTLVRKLDYRFGIGMKRHDEKHAAFLEEIIKIAQDKRSQKPISRLNPRSISINQDMINQILKYLITEKRRPDIVELILEDLKDYLTKDQLDGINEIYQSSIETVQVSDENRINIAANWVVEYLLFADEKTTIKLASSIDELAKLISKIPRSKYAGKPRLARKAIKNKAAEALKNIEIKKDDLLSTLCGKTVGRSTSRNIIELLKKNLQEEIKNLDADRIKNPSLAGKIDLLMEKRQRIFVKFFPINQKIFDCQMENRDLLQNKKNRNSPEFKASQQLFQESINRLENKRRRLDEQIEKIDNKIKLEKERYIKLIRSKIENFQQLFSDDSSMSIVSIAKKDYQLEIRRPNSALSVDDVNADSSACEQVVYKELEEIDCMFF